MIKFKLFINLEKEEKWLSQMAQQGFMLNRVSMFYHFTKGNAQDETYRIDYRDFKTSYDFEDYKALFEDSGWIHVSGTRTSGLQYFKKYGDKNNEDIFTDVRSRALRYKRLSERYLLCSVPFIFWFIVLITQGTVDFNYFLSPKDWYLTPGLWELEGFDFLFSFLFETPFAVMRGCSWLIAVLGIILYLVFVIRLKILYKKSLKS